MSTTAVVTAPKFSLKNFFLSLLEAAPSIIVEAFTIKDEAQTGASRTQLATDSLNAATGITEALTSSDPDVQQDAAVASAVVGQVIQSIQQVSATTTPTTAHVQQAVVTAALATPPPVAT